MEIHSVHINFDNQTIEVNGMLLATQCDEYILVDDGWDCVAKINGFKEVIVKNDSIVVAVNSENSKKKSIKW